MFERGLKRTWPAYLVLVAGLTLSITAWLYVKNSVDAVEAARFDNAVRMAQQSLDQQMQRYVDVLLATRGFVQASEPVSRAEWKTYTQSIDLVHHFPGMQGIGYAERVPIEGVPAFQARVRGEGFPNFIIRPPGIRSAYFPVLYLEPFDMRNQRALGFDLGSDPVRQRAMERAAWDGSPAATGRVTLLQEDGIDTQPGFLILVPDYNLNMPTDTQEERAAALQGFIYSPYRAHVLFGGMFEHQRYLSAVHWQVYAGTSAQSAELLYDSEAGHLVRENPDLAPREIVSEVAGQPWYLRFAALPTFRTPTENFLPWLVLLSGVLMSWLFCGVTWQQIRGRVISERAAAGLRRTQEALRESELRYRLKVEQSPMAIAVFSSSGDAQYQNPAFRELFDVGPHDLDGYNLLDDPRLSRAEVMSDVRRAFAGESVVIGPYLYQPPKAHGGEAQARWVRTVIYPIRSTDGSLSELVVMHEDFTQRKQAEEELRRAKEEAEAANRSKDQFLAVLSHELRNPLAPVLTTVNLLQEHQLTGEEFGEALNVIQRNVELEARLIDDLLDITRIIRGKLNLDLDTVNAHTALRHALEICQADLHHKQQSTGLRLEATEHWVRADPARLQQVFWNVLKNAVKFTPAGGSIRIKTYNRLRGEQSREGSGSGQGAANSELVVEITDTGIGIEPGKLGLIFEAFEQIDHSITRRFGGLGLGLAISRAVCVKAHQGTLTASSGGSGQGTTFTLTLPTAAQPAAAGRPFPVRAMPTGRPGVRRVNQEKPRILLVEDQDDARRGLAKILEKSGYTVYAAANAQEALELARTERFDVLLSDLGLPDASGFELVRELRRDARHGFYAVALSGLGMEDDVQRARQAGFDEHMTKPVQFGRLMGLIEKCGMGE